MVTPQREPTALMELTELTESMRPAVQRSSRRQTLREFQRQLVERTQQADTHRSNELLRLALHAGDQGFLIDVAHTSEVVPFERVTPVLHTRDWFLGLINCRGKLTGVVDFAGFLGQAITPVQDSDRLLVLADDLPVPCALRVSRVSGLVSLSGLSSETSTGSEPAWVSALHTDREGRRWRSLNLLQLMCDPAFLDVVR